MNSIANAVETYLSNNTFSAAEVLGSFEGVECTEVQGESTDGSEECDWSDL
jgi:hypothetical protein